MKTTQLCDVELLFLNEIFYVGERLGGICIHW